MAQASKQHAHELIDRMAPHQMSAVVNLLETMLETEPDRIQSEDPVSRAIANAPVDDEPVSDEERREIAAARASFERGEAIPNEEVLADFGLTAEDFERMGRTPLEPHSSDQ